MNLRARHVSVRFGNTIALDRVDLGFPEGGNALVVGGAGSGKTTLLKVLAGLRDPDEGSVEWDEQPIAALDFDAKRRQQGRFGMVFQSDALFDSMTVLENVLLPLRRKLAPDVARESALKVLRSVGLAEAVDTYPERLSGGMRKRTGLARALVADPEVLFADDPLAGLDPATAQQVCELLQRFSRQRSLLIAAPEPLPFLPSPRWLVLRKGRLIHDGAPQPALLDAPEEIEAPR